MKISTERIASFINEYIECCERQHITCDVRYEDGALVLELILNDNSLVVCYPFVEIQSSRLTSAGHAMMLSEKAIRQLKGHASYVS